MKVLTIDIGTGTQDIFLLDTRLGVENGFKMVLPSPTLAVRRDIQAATRRKDPILLTGVTMGGGPSHWAVEDHLAAGLQVFATPAAARSFNDDLDEIAGMGIEVVSVDEAEALAAKTLQFELKDLDLPALIDVFTRFGVSMDDLDLVAAAVFDHGAAPPGYSDRKFRFEYIEEVVTRTNRLSAFAFPAAAIPARMTRMRAVAASAADSPAPLMLMDTAPAAVLGALLDPHVEADAHKVVANIGNFHTLAFRLGPEGIEGVFEHHTGFMSPEKLDRLIGALANGSLTDDDVFHDRGHGARVLSAEPIRIGPGGGQTVVVGPRRALMAGSAYTPYFAAPFGDMMLVGCFGMLAAAADVFPEMADPLRSALSRRADTGTAPWEF